MTTKFTGTGNAGATEGVDVLASWINAQIGQSMSADPLPLDDGFGALGEAGVVRSAKTDWAADVRISPSAWTWPNVSTS